ncbi:MAG: hypothetical protein ACYDGM_09820 [Vulcanimicrobiaceae bacterium]
MLPIVAAGGSFAGSSVVGVLAGIALAGRTGQQLWVLGGLLLGMAVGAYAAIRLVIGSR